MASSKPNHQRSPRLASAASGTSPKAESAQRLKIIYDELVQLATEYQPELFVLEDVIFSKNVTSAFAVGEARGVAKLVAASINRQVYSYPGRSD